MTGRQPPSTNFLSQKRQSARKAFALHIVGFPSSEERSRVNTDKLVYSRESAVRRERTVRCCNKLFCAPLRAATGGQRTDLRQQRATNCCAQCARRRKLVYNASRANFAHFYRPAQSGLIFLLPRAHSHITALSHSGDVEPCSKRLTVASCVS